MSRAAERASPCTCTAAPGIGKTALIGRFLNQLREREPDAVVLTGRCYERESVPYKALDNIVDELSQYLRRIGREADAVMPRDVAALARLFPVLRRVEPIALSRDRSAEIADSQELRRRGFRRVPRAVRAPGAPAAGRAVHRRSALGRHRQRRAADRSAPAAGLRRPCC